jgi:ribosomal protein S18 acetylase RimI-like enzyme
MTARPPTLRPATLRPPTLADVPGIIAFWRVAAEDTGRPPDTAAAVEALIARDPAALILAVAGPVLVGTIIAGWDGWRCHLYRLAVAPDRRGEGIACLLIEAAEERLRGLGGGRVDAMVLDGNAPAHPVWRACGYTPQAEWSRWTKSFSSPGVGNTPGG